MTNYIIIYERDCFQLGSIEKSASQFWLLSDFDNFLIELQNKWLILKSFLVLAHWWLPAHLILCLLLHNPCLTVTAISRDCSKCTTMSLYFRGHIEKQFFSPYYCAYPASLLVEPSQTRVRLYVFFFSFVLIFSYQETTFISGASIRGHCCKEASHWRKYLLNSLLLEAKVVFCSLFFCM